MKKPQGNDFLNRIQDIDSDSVEWEQRFVFTQDFKKVTGIHHNRMANIVKSEGKDAKIDEVEKILKYYRQKTGKDVSFNDLFPSSEK